MPGTGYPGRFYPGHEYPVIDLPFRNFVLESLIRRQWEPNPVTVIWQGIGVPTPFGDQPRPWRQDALRTSIRSQWEPPPNEAQFKGKVAPQTLVYGQTAPYRPDAIRATVRLSWEPPSPLPPPLPKTVTLTLPRGDQPTPYKPDRLIRGLWEPNAPTLLWQQISVQTPVGDTVLQGRPWVQQIFSQWVTVQPTQQAKYAPQSVVQTQPFRYDGRIAGLVRAWDQAFVMPPRFVFSPLTETVIVSPPVPYRPHRVDDDCTDRPRDDQSLQPARLVVGSADSERPRDDTAASFRIKADESSASRTRTDEGMHFRFRSDESISQRTRTDQADSQRLKADEAQAQRPKADEPETPARLKPDESCTDRPRDDEAT